MDLKAILDRMNKIYRIMSLFRRYPRFVSRKILTADKTDGYGWRSSEKRILICQACWHYCGRMKPLLRRKARQGGKARSDLKTLAARQNARLRWHGAKEDGVIPAAALIDGAWYRGRGRTAPIAIWDAHVQTFHTVGMSSYRDPLNFPQISRRATRLKQEAHVAMPGGSFAPIQILAQ